MSECYDRFLALGLDLSPLGLEPTTREDGSFCTPLGARLVGRLGVDGIHFCFVPGFGETVFAVSPMAGPGDYVHPLAENWEDFLRLLLACRSANVLEQIYQWQWADFDHFLAQDPVTPAQEAALAALAQATGLTPMEEPFPYVKGLQARFDCASLPFSQEYYDLTGELSPSPSPAPAAWKVTFEGGFWSSRGRACREMALGAQFQWAGRAWVLPALYTCSKGLVLDLCMAVPPEEIRRFLEKWALDPETEGERTFTPARRMELERENPLDLDFTLSLTLNGKTLRQTHGYGTTYNPCLPEGFVAESEAQNLLRHYGLDPALGWHFRRTVFPWATRRAPRLRSLSLTLKARQVSYPGPEVTFTRPGEEARFPHPVTGEEVVLTALALEEGALPPGHFPREDWECPTRYRTLTYALSPALSRRDFDLRDSRQGDPSRPRTSQPGAPAAAGAVALIGGADGPTTLFVGSTAARQREAISSLWYDLPGETTWQTIFRVEEHREETITVL